MTIENPQVGVLKGPNLAGTDQRKSLIVFSASVRPHGSRGLNRRRARTYRQSLELIRLFAPSGWDIVIVENTLRSQAAIANCFGPEARGLQIITVGTNRGTVNKGLGAIDMLSAAEGSVDFGSYQYIAAFAGHRLLTCPYPFEMVETHHPDALVSAGNFRFLDGRVIKSETSRMYIDMLFVLRSRLMMSYLSEVRSIIATSETGLGNTEAQLYGFLARRPELNVLVLSALGVLRNQPRRWLPPWIEGSWHSC